MPVHLVTSTRIPEEQPPPVVAERYVEDVALAVLEESQELASFTRFA